MSVSTLVHEKYDVSDNNVFNTKKGLLHLPPSSGLSKKEKAFLSLAMKVAETSDVDNRHGAVVVKNGRVLSLGINKWRNRGLYQGNTFENVLTVHAEVDALSRVSDTEGVVVYVARVGDNGEARFSRPCQHCMAELENRGIKRVVYTLDN